MFYEFLYISRYVSMIHSNIIISYHIVFVHHMLGVICLLGILVGFYCWKSFRNYGASHLTNFHIQQIFIT